MSKQTVLIIFGGASSEHDVSIMSARNVGAALDRDKYDVKLCYITRLGDDWRLVESFDDLTGSTLQPLLGQSGFTAGGQTIPIDVVFPVLHGKNGEDGTVQGLLELVGVPYVGCKVEASALCMDKAATKRIARSRTAKWLEFTGHDLPLSQERQDDIIEKLGAGPWFVKPSRAGSSVGVTKVTKIEDVGVAIKNAHSHDDIALVEEAIIGREIEVAVLGNPPHHKASVIGEILPGADFYDYDDKYSSKSTSATVIDPDMSLELKNNIQQQARNIYERLGCTGLARVDFFVTEELDVYLNEVNTMPGFTNISMYPKLWQHVGMSYSELIDTLISDA